LARRGVSHVAVSAALIAVGSCCTDPELEVPSLRGRLDFGFDVASDVAFDADMRVDFDGDLALWCGIDAATEWTVDFDFSGLDAYEQTLDVDIDDDGVPEKVVLIAFAAADPADPERVFCSWKGDEYTYDAGRCYLLWWEGDTVRMLSAPCGRDEPALSCSKERDDAASFSCGVCEESGRCAPCDARTVDDCVQEGADALGTTTPSTDDTGGASGTGGVAGVSGEAGAPAAGHAGAPAGGSAGASSGAAGAAGAAAEESCADRAVFLATRAKACDLANLRPISELCSARVAQVDQCYLAVNGFDRLGSECDALTTAVCAGVFP